MCTALETFAYTFPSDGIAFSRVIVKGISYAPWDSCWWDLNSERWHSKDLVSHWLHSNPSVSSDEYTNLYNSSPFQGAEHYPFTPAPHTIKPVEFPTLFLPGCPRDDSIFFYYTFDLQIKSYSLFTLVWRPSLSYLWGSLLSVSVAYVFFFLLSLPSWEFKPEPPTYGASSLPLS